MPTPKKPTVEQHLRERLQDARATNERILNQRDELLICNNSQNAQLQNKLNREIELEGQIQSLSENLTAVQSKLFDSQAAYTHRHNQELETSRQLSKAKHEINDLRFQFNMTQREFTRLLLLEQFSGGKENELMLTRSRNRVLDLLNPTIHGEAQQIIGHSANEARPTEEELEKTGA